MTRTKLIAAKSEKGNYRRRGYAYWRALVESVLRQLQRDFDNGQGHEKISSNVLLGMCIANVVQKPEGFRRRALECCRAAAQAKKASPAAQATLTHFSDAVKPGRMFENAKEVQDLLYKASCSGSSIAASALQRLNSGLLIEAQQVHRGQGGYNSETFNQGLQSTRIYRACAAGNADEAKELLAQGADASVTQSPTGVSCLHLHSIPEEWPT